MAPQQRRQVAALLPALLVLPKARHDLANRQPPLGATGLCVTQPAPQLPAPRAPSEQGGPGTAGLPPPRGDDARSSLTSIRHGRALWGGEERCEGGQAAGARGRAAGKHRPAVIWGCCPVAGAGRGAPPSTASSRRGSQRARRLSLTGLSDGERADAIGHNPAATTPQLPRGGEKQPPRHRKRRGGGEGRKENHSPRQANCSLPRGLGLPESQHPGAGTAGSCSIPLGCPRHLPWGRGTSGI